MCVPMYLYARCSGCSGVSVVGFTAGFIAAVTAASRWLLLQDLVVFTTGSIVAFTTVPMVAFTTELTGEHVYVCL